MHDDWPSLAGLHDCSLQLADGALARASIALPAGETAGAPLVLCLHYGGTPVGDYGRALLEGLFVPAWRTLGAVMIAPVSPHGDWTHSHDTALALELLALAAARYGCGPRIVTGYSLGAIGTWHLLRHCPSDFVAGVPIAGPPPAACAGMTPVRALNSGADRLFPADATRAAVEALARTGRDAACVLIDGVDHYAFGSFRDALSAQLPWLADRCAAHREQR